MRADLTHPCSGLPAIQMSSLPTASTAGKRGSSVSIPVRECIFVSDAGVEDAFAPGQSLMAGAVHFLIEHRSASVRVLYIPLLFGISLAVKWVGMKPYGSASEVGWLPVTWHFSFRRMRRMATNVVSWTTESEGGTGLALVKREDG